MVTMKTFIVVYHNNFILIVFEAHELFSIVGCSHGLRDTMKRRDIIDSDARKALEEHQYAAGCDLTGLRKLAK